MDARTIVAQLAAAKEHYTAGRPSEAGRLLSSLNSIGSSVVSLNASLCHMAADGDTAPPALSTGSAPTPPPSRRAAAARAFDQLAKLAADHEPAGGGGATASVPQLVAAYNAAVCAATCARYATAAKCCRRVVDEAQNCQKQQAADVAASARCLHALLLLLQHNDREALKVITAAKEAADDEHVANIYARCIVRTSGMESLTNEDKNYLSKYRLSQLWAMDEMRQCKQPTAAVDRIVQSVLWADSDKRSVPPMQLVCSSNNAACALTINGRPALALVHWQRAIDNAKRMLVNDSLHAWSPPTQHAVAYNSGVALLLAGRPTAAFDRLMPLATVYSKSARLWLRLAECCMQAHTAGNEHVPDGRGHDRLVVKTVLGVGPHRKVLLAAHSNEAGDQWCATGGGLQQQCGDSAMPACTLHFGLLCARNAVSLVPRCDEHALDDAMRCTAATAAGRSKAWLAPSPPSAHMDAVGAHQLRSSALCAQAYIALRLGDVHLAQASANTLLGIKHVAPAHRLLGRLYLAESLCTGGRYADAAQLLQAHGPVLSVSVDPRGRTATANGNGTRLTVAMATAVLVYNMAVCEALRGQCDRAALLLDKAYKGLPAEQQPAEFTLLRCFLELRQDRSDTARQIMQQYATLR